MKFKIKQVPNIDSLKKKSKNKSKIILNDLLSLKNVIKDLSQGNLSAKLEMKSTPQEVLNTHDEYHVSNALNNIILSLRDIAYEFNSITEIPCKRLCYVGSDSYLEGQQCGELMGEALKGKGQVVIITSYYYYVSSELRRKGFESVIRLKYPDIHIVDYVENKRDKELTFQKTKQLIKKFHDLKGIYICEGATPFAIANALIEMKKEKKIKIISHDLTDDTMNFVKEGIITATLGQDPFAQGHDSVIHLYNHLVDNWEPQTPRILTHMDVVTKDNYHHFWTEKDGQIQSKASLERLAKPINKVPSKQLRIGILGRLESQFWNPVKQGVVEAGEKLKDKKTNVEWIVPKENIKDGNVSSELYGPFIDSLVDKGFDGIGVIASNSEIIPYLNRAVDAGVPVVTLNSEPFSLSSLVFTITDNADKLIGFGHHLASSSREAKDMTMQINAAMEEMSQGTESQNKNVKKTHESMNDLVENIQSIKNDAEENVQEMEQTLAAVNNGTAAMEETISSLRTIEKSVGDSWQIVDELGEYSTQIDKIVMFINDIASHINVLGLNATIEAVKAGEYGKSFSVVANEIRQMVVNTKEHTNEIVDLISRFKEGIQTVEKVMSEGIAKIKQSENLTDKAVESIKNINGFVQVNKTRMDNISSAMNEIESFSQSVNVAMNNVAIVSEQNAKEVENVNNFTKEMEMQLNVIDFMANTLSDMAESEKQLLAKFNISEK